jgi:hypothetical protein
MFLKPRPFYLVLFHSILAVSWAFAAYDPAVGRFISRDPIAESGGLNLYRYVGNSPINGTDPDGLSPDDGGFDGGEVAVDSAKNLIHLLTGIGDAATFGATERLRAGTPLSDDGYLNKCSAFYRAGNVYGGVGMFFFGGGKTKVTAINTELVTDNYGTFLRSYNVTRIPGFRRLDAYFDLKEVTMAADYLSLKVEASLVPRIVSENAHNPLINNHYTFAAAHALMRVPRSFIRSEARDIARRLLPPGSGYKYVIFSGMRETGAKAASEAAAVIRVRVNW